MVSASQNHGVDRRVLALWHAKISAEKKVLACEMLVGCGLLACRGVDVVWEKLVQTVLRLHHHGAVVEVYVLVVWGCAAVVLKCGVFVVVWVAVCRRHVQRLKYDEHVMSAVWPREETVQTIARWSEVVVACALSEVKCLIDATAIYSLCGARE